MRSTRVFDARTFLATASLCALVGCGSSADGQGSTKTSDESATMPTMSTEVASGHSNRWGGYAWSGKAHAHGNKGSSQGGSSTPPAPAPTDTTPTPAPTSAPTTPPAPSAPPSTPIPYRGINLSGAEFGGNVPGTYGTDYTFPTNAEVDYYVSKGMTTFRVPFRWERLQTSTYAAFDATYLARLDALVSYATAKGAHVVLNPQNFARYYGSLIGSSAVPNAAFADFWSKLSAKYASNPRVMFNLVNEPNTMPTEQWVSAANAAIAAIRAGGATNTIIAPGNAWTGAASWYSSDYGTPNAVAMLDIQDPIDNTLIEAHEYLDSDASGGSSSCVSATIGSQRLAPFVKWLRDNHKRGFLGEFATANNATCNAALKDMLEAIMAAQDVLEGFLWWGGGPWWGNYMFSLEPNGSSDAPQMSLLAPYLF